MTKLFKRLLSLKSLILISCLIGMITLMPACTTAGGAPPLLQPVTSTVPVVTTNTMTVTNTTYVTNVVTQTLTNGVTVTNTVVATNYTAQTYPLFVTNTVTTTNSYVVSSTVTNAIATIGALNSATSAVDPFSSVIGLILTGSLAGLGYYASLKSKQAASHLSTAQTIITAVEGLAPTIAPAVKAAVQAQSVKLGTTQQVAAVVQAVTANFPVTAPAPVVLPPPAPAAAPAPVKTA